MHIAQKASWLNKSLHITQPILHIRQDQKNAIAETEIFNSSARLRVKNSTATKSFCISRSGHNGRDKSSTVFYNLNPQRSND